MHVYWKNRTSIISHCQNITAVYILIHILSIILFYICTLDKYYFNLNTIHTWKHDKINLVTAVKFNWDTKKRYVFISEIIMINPCLTDYNYLKVTIWLFSLTSLVRNMTLLIILGIRKLMWNTFLLWWNKTFIYSAYLE